MKKKSPLHGCRRLAFEPLERRELLAAQPLPVMPPAGYDQGGLYPAGTVNSVSYYSPSQGKTDTMYVYTPPGYNPSQKYGVIYGYPGIGAGADTIFAGWCVDAGGLADNLIGQGKIKSVIIVGIDDNNGDVQSDTLNVIIPYVDSHYSTYADADHRGLYGYSWGGQYTLNIGCSNLNTFHYLSPSSPALFSTGTGPGFFPSGGAEAKQKMKCFLLSCGTADWDGFYPPSQDLHNYCVSNGISHGWLPVNGEGHDAGVWRPAMWNFLQMADRAGISAPPVPKSAYSQVEAVNYDTQSGGVGAETCSDTGGGQDLADIQNGCDVSFNNVDFGLGAVSFNARVASANSGGNIELHLDSLTGPLVGTCAVSGTGGWQTWVTKSCTVSGASGIHNLYLKFTGGSGYLFNVNWWKFNTTTLPTSPSAPTGLVATAGVEQTSLSWTASSNATSYDVKRSTTSGGPYTTVANVAGTNYTDSSVFGGTTYYYVVSALNDGGESANSAQASVTPTVNAPSPWLARDVGTPGLAGGESVANGVFTVIGSGADVGGSSDACHFVYVPATGDCTIVARVASLDSYIDPGSKAGVMIRASLDANAANAFIAVTPSNGITFQSRPSTGGATSSNSASGLTAPYWVKLVRSGNTFTGSYSADGTTWTQLGSATFTMATAAYVGLALTSHNDYTLCSATFDSVTAPGWVHPPATTPTGLVATPGVEQVSLSWAASSNATSYNVKRATTSGGPYTTVANVTTTNYTDTRLVAGTHYYYVVSAVNSLAGESSNSAQVTAIPTSNVPSPWKTQDIGTTGVWGSASQSSGVFTMAGSGDDIQNSADAFRFVYTTTTSSSFTIVARVASLQNVNSWSKAGVMIRDSLDPGAANAFIAVTPGNGVTFQYRSSDGGGSNYVATGGISAPYWVKLVASGGTFTGYRSADGTNWTQVGSTTLTISTAYVGLAVTSHNNSSLCTATFDHVSAPGWPLTPLVASATAVSSGQVNLTWNPQTGATSYNVKRSTASGGPYTTIATGVATTNYTDTGVSLTSGAKYYYVVSAVVGGSETANGPEAAPGFSMLTGATIGTAGSYNNLGNTIANVFDDDLTTFFDGPNSDGCWAGLDFGAGASNVITQINYCPRSGFESRMVGGIFQGANKPDFSDAVTLATVGTQPTAGVLTSVNVAGTAAFRYVRYLSPSGSWGNVAEVQFYGYLDTPTVATAASASPSPVAGTTANLSVLGADIGGEAKLTYAWSMTSGPAAVSYSANGTNAAKHIVATFTRAGSYTFRATITNSAGLSTTSSVSVTVNPTYSGLSLSPAAPNLTGGATQQFAATALDQFGQALASQPTITWTLVSGQGTLTSGGLYTPPYATDSATVRALSGVYNATATVTYSSQAQWNATSNSWTTSGNWKDAFTSAALAAPGVRSLTGDTVLFASAAGQVARLDGATPTLAGITFNNAIAGYTIDQGSGGSLTLQGSSGATVSVLAGSHTISAPVHLVSNTTFSATASGTLTVTAPIDGSGSLTVAGGKLVLNTANTFSGGLVVQSGTVVVNVAGGLLDGSSLTVGAAGAFGSPIVTSAPAALGARVGNLPSPSGRGAGGEGPGASTPTTSAATCLSSRAVAAVMAADPPASSVPLWIRRAAAALRPTVSASFATQSVKDSWWRT